MVDMEVERSAVAEVLAIGLVGHMELELVLMEDTVLVNMVDMEDMVVVWVVTGGSPPLDTQVAMEALIEVMIWLVIMGALLRVMEDMVAVQVPVVAMEMAQVAMMWALGVAMEAVVGVLSLEIEGDMVVQEAVGIIPTGGRSLD